MVELANISNTLFDKKSPVHLETEYPGGDNMQTNIQGLI